MHPLLSPLWIAACVILLSVAPTAPLSGQRTELQQLGLGGQGSKLQALGEVMGFRRDVVGDSTPFDACRVYEVAGRPATYPAEILIGYRSLLHTNSETPCAPNAPATNDWAVVRVDSMVLADTVGRVHLTVLRGEWRHFEEHALRRGSSSRSWGVSEVRLWGAVRFARIPRPARS